MNRNSKREGIVKGFAEPAGVGPEAERVSGIDVRLTASRFWAIVFSTLVTTTEEYALAEAQQAFLIGNVS